MSTPAYVTINGKVQGNITTGAGDEASLGNAQQQDHQDEIIAHAIKHDVLVPTDPQSGQPTGQRVHKPFTFTCSLNKAVPLMYNALTQGESLTKVETKYWRTSSQGQPEHFFTTTLEDAIIVDINQVMPHTRDMANDVYTELLDVMMTYRKITWSHKIAATEGFDDWYDLVGSSQG